MSTRWLRIAAVYFVVAISLGLYMGMTEKFTEVPVHAHLNLLGWVSMALFGLVWGLAAIGATLKALDRMAHPFLSTGLYLGMGWLCVIAAKPLLLSVATPGLVLLAAGGLAYTAGVVFFALDSRLRYAHFVWHLFVVAGTACHFFAVLDYSI